MAFEASYVFCIPSLAPLPTPFAPPPKPPSIGFSPFIFAASEPAIAPSNAPPAAPAIAPPPAIAAFPTEPANLLND